MELNRLVVGCMTGTSIDGLDCALARITGRGLAMRAELLATHSAPIPDGLRQTLRRIAAAEPLTAAAIARAAREFGELHANTIADLLKASNTPKPDLIAVHGQTVFHSPPDSWQLINPAPIARAHNCPVVSDLRAADLAAGGQGAPITPLADFTLFRHESLPTAVVNLGGFCNITLLPAAPASADPASLLPHIRGFDVCACNQILDDLARKVLRADYDESGAAALRGHPHEEALIDLEGVLATQSSSKRSLGTGDESAEWVSRWRVHVPADDLAATACEGIGRTIAERIVETGAERILLAGGGARNAALVKAIASWVSSTPVTTDTLGVDVSSREALCMAVLGALSHDRVPITLPQVTRCPPPAPIAGSWLLP